MGDPRAKTHPHRREFRRSKKGPLQALVPLRTRSGARGSTSWRRARASFGYFLGCEGGNRSTILATALPIDALRCSGLSPICTGALAKPSQTFRPVAVSLRSSEKDAVEIALSGPIQLRTVIS